MERGNKKNVTFWSAACKVLSLKPNYQLTSAEQNSFRKLLNNVPTCHEMCIPSCPSEEPEYRAFNTWMFGQLLQIIIRPEYKSIHASATDCHAALLNLLKEYNGKIFESILKCYLEAFEDLISTNKEMKKKKIISKQCDWFKSCQVSSLTDSIQFKQFSFTLKCINSVNEIIVFILDNVLVPHLDYFLSTSLINNLLYLIFKTQLLHNAHTLISSFNLIKLIIQMSYNSQSICLFVSDSIKSIILNFKQDPIYQQECFELLKLMYLHKYNSHFCLDVAYFILEHACENYNYQIEFQNSLCVLISQMQEGVPHEDIEFNIRIDFSINSLPKCNSQLRILENHIVRQIKEINTERVLILYEQNILWKRILTVCLNVPSLNLNLIESLTQSAVHINQCNSFTNQYSNTSEKIEMFSAEILTKIYEFIIMVLKSGQGNENILRSSQRICCHLAMLSPREDYVYICALPYLYLIQNANEEINSIHTIYKNILDNFKLESLKYLSQICPLDNPQLSICIMTMFTSVTLEQLIPYLPMIVYNYTKLSRKKNLANQTFKLSTGQKMLKNIFEKLDCASEHMKEVPHELYSKYYAKIICAQHSGAYCKRNIETNNYEIFCNICNYKIKQEQPQHRQQSELNLYTNPFETLLQMILCSNNIQIQLNSLQCFPVLYNHWNYSPPTTTSPSSIPTNENLINTNYNIIKIIKLLLNNSNDVLKYKLQLYFNQIILLGYKNIYLYEQKAHDCQGAQMYNIGNNDKQRTQTSINGEYKLNRNENKEIKNLFYEIFIEITNLCYQSLLNQDYKLQEYLVQILLVWGLIPLEFTLLPVLKSILLFVSHPYSNYTELATAYLEQIICSHKLKINTLFIRYENILSQICADHLLLSVIHFPTNKDIIECFSFAFGYSKQTFLQEFLHKHLMKHLLPYAIDNDKVYNLLESLCDNAGTTLSIILQSSFQYVYPHVLLFHKHNINQIQDFIVKETNLNIKNLICQSYSSIIAYIITYYHKNKVSAQQALLVVKQYDMVYKPSSCQTQEGIAEFLSIRFLGILNQLENSLTKNDTPDDIKKNILLSLTYILPLLGSRYITPIRFKVLVTLRTALQLKRNYFPFFVINVWDSFIRNVNGNCIGPMLSTIFVSLLPLLPYYVHEVSDLFHYIIVTNEIMISNHIQELYFLPFSTEVANVYEIVQNYVKIMESKSLQSRLELLIKYVNHETIEVKLHALERLHKEISENQAEVRQLMLASDSVHSIVLELLDVLTLGFSERDERIRIKCGECVGELGAVDPSHRPNKIMKSDLTKGILLDIKSPEFVIQSLTILSQGFQSARHSRTIDAFALAIQNMLSVYSITPQASLWERFPEHVQEVMKPLTTSRYTMDMNAVEPTVPHPIFGSLRGKTYELWTYSWITRLISFVSDESIKNIFTYCKGSMRNDATTLHFFLPYMLLHAIISSDENISMIHEEMIAVLNGSTTVPLVGIPHSYRQIHTEQSDRVSLLSSSCDSIMCMKTIFSLIDYLNKWLRDNAIIKNKTELLIKQCKTLSGFLNKIDQLNLAKKALQCKEYSRALLFLEQHMKQNGEKSQNQLPMFGEIYAHLNDTDSLQGIVAINEGEPSPEEMILLHEATGQHQDAAACYDKLAQKNGENLFCKRTIQCYLSINQPFTALQIARGFKSSGKCNEDLLSEEAEAMLNLMNFDNLENFIVKTNNFNIKNWGVGIGKATLHLRNKNMASLKQEISELRSVLTDSLFTSTGYREGYDYIVKLHMLSEFEKLATLTIETLKNETLSQTQISNQFSDLINNFDERLKLMQPQGRVIEPVLCLRRVSLTIAQQLCIQEKNYLNDLFNQSIGNCWLKSIGIARKASNFQQAYSNILAVDDKIRSKKLFIEKAKLLWDKMEYVRALDTLNKGLDMHFPDIEQVKNASIEDRRTCAEAKLLVATYNDEMVNVDMDLNLKNYRYAVLVWNRWEKSIVYLAQYQDRLLSAIEGNEFYTNHLDFFSQTVMYFGKSLSYGTEYIYQSMPRMISLWLDFGAQLSKDSKLGPRPGLYINERTETLAKVTRTIENFVNKLPTYMFFTAFSQIVSRICHPNDECFKLIKHIIVKCILEYPNHALWMFMSLHKSPYQLRMNRFNNVLKDNRLKPITEFVSKFQRLVEYLSHLCNMPSPKTSTCSLRTLNKSLVRLLSEGLFSDIMIPIQRLRTLSLPSAIDQERSHNPFSEELVYFQGVEDHVHIFSSLKRPKMITFLGSDGNKYPMICKPKDDLRQDFRLMEFNSIVNMYLKRDPEARDRSLNIRTYSVVPLIDDCGLLEMVPHLTTLRQALMTAYVAIDKVPQLKNIRKFFCDKSEPLEKKKEMFLNHLVPAHPPVLRDWFLREFPSPSLWYLARNAYIRTCAVMSIVGYILGLGDRHGENILLDSMSGDLIHVDFNCLFNKGEQFDFPERVPFRLTHNMVDAMGVGGLEGVFLHSCEITNRVLRVQKEQLLSVLKPFLFDPLVNWQGRGFKGNENAEMTNNEAKIFLENIEGRLQGKVRSGGQNTTIPLSVEGQTKKLIEEATSIENLCQMYHGWAAYQ